VSGFPRIEPLGDSALLVTLGTAVDVALNARVVRLAAAVRGLAWPGVLDVVPAYASLAVFFDPLRTDPDALARRLTGVVAEPSGAGTDEGRLHIVSVRYDGPDLAVVAELTGLAPADVVRRHAARDYRVLFLGFVPGFAYLGPLDPLLVLPRRAEPRRQVPAGSVAIAGAQTGIYPLPTPGGWHLIGRTTLVLFDPDREPPTLLAPGDRVRFAPLDP
jgi:KipI family sensor histidine kinase inhibitor